MATQSEIKYNRLMEKAEELFMKFGYKSISMDEIATAAGISKMTVYKHFSSKEALFIEIVLSIMHKTSVLLEEEMKKVSGTLEKIDFLMNFNMEASKNYSLAFYKDIMSIPTITEKLMEEKYRVSRIMFAGIIKEGMEKGEIRKVNVDFVTDMLMMIVDGFGKKYIDVINSREDMEGTIEDFFDFLKYGLLGGKEVE